MWLRSPPPESGRHQLLHVLGGVAVGVVAVLVAGDEGAARGFLGLLVQQPVGVVGGGDLVLVRLGLGGDLPGRVVLEGGHLRAGVGRGLGVGFLRQLVQVVVGVGAVGGVGQRGGVVGPGRQVGVSVVPVAGGVHRVAGGVVLGDGGGAVVLVVLHHVVRDRRALGGIGDAGLVAVGVVGVGVGVVGGVGVAGVVADDLHRVGDDGAATVFRQADLLVLPGLGERPLAESHPAVAVVLRLVHRRGGGAAVVVHRVGGAGSGAGDDGVLDVNGVVPVGGDVQVPSEGVGAGAGRVGLVLRALAARGGAALYRAPGPGHLHGRVVGLGDLRVHACGHALVGNRGLFAVGVVAPAHGAGQVPARGGQDPGGLLAEGVVVVAGGDPGRVDRIVGPAVVEITVARHVPGGRVPDGGADTDDSRPSAS